MGYSSEDNDELSVAQELQQLLDIPDSSFSWLEEELTEGKQQEPSLIVPARPNSPQTIRLRSLLRLARTCLTRRGSESGRAQLCRHHDTHGLSTLSFTLLLLFLLSRHIPTSTTRHTETRKRLMQMLCKRTASAVRHGMYPQQLQPLGTTQ